MLERDPGSLSKVNEGHKLMFPHDRVDDLLVGHSTGLGIPILEPISGSYRVEFHEWG